MVNLCQNLRVERGLRPGFEFRPRRFLLQKDFYILESNKFCDIMASTTLPHIPNVSVVDLSGLSHRGAEVWRFLESKGFVPEQHFALPISRCIFITEPQPPKAGLLRKEVPQKPKAIGILFFYRDENDKATGSLEWNVWTVSEEGKKILLPIAEELSAKYGADIQIIITPRY